MVPGMLGWLIGRRTTKGILESLAESDPTFRAWQRLEKRRQKLLDKRAQLLEEIREIDAELRLIENQQRSLISWRFP